MSEGIDFYAAIDRLLRGPPDEEVVRRGRLFGLEMAQDESMPDFKTRIVEYLKKETDRC